MNVYTAVTIQNLAILIVIALSIWWTETFWACWLIFAWTTVKSKDRE